MFFLTIYNTKHDSPKIMRCVVENSVFLFLCGFKVQIKMGFTVLEIWLFCFENVLEFFLKEFVRILNLVLASDIH